MELFIEDILLRILILEMSDKVYTIEEIKNMSRDMFSKRDFIEKAYLFGSYAKNTASKDSDIDIVVALNSPVGMKLYSLYDEIEETFGKNTDVFTENEILNIMPKTYKNDRILLYER